MGIVPRRSGLAAALLIAALPAVAHHSRAIFDRETTITVRGVVTGYEWSNPHVYLYVETQTDTGEPVVWELEHGSTTAMRRQGWSRDTFAPGDRITVQASPARETANMALVSSVERAGVRATPSAGGKGTFSSSIRRISPITATGMLVAFRRDHKNISSSGSS